MRSRLDWCDVAVMFSYPLVREIVAIVAIKMAILIGAGLLVFGPNRVAITASSVEAHLFHSALESH